MPEKDVQPRLVRLAHRLAAVKVQERAANLLAVRVAWHVVRPAERVCIVRRDDDFDLALGHAVDGSERVVELVEQGFVELAQLRLGIGVVAVRADEEADDACLGFHDGLDGCIAVLWCEILQ